MRVELRTTRFLATLALVVISTASLHASAFERASLERLTATNETIVVGEAIGAHSYWSSDKSFILTDVNLEVRQMIRGEAGARQVVVTLLGGTVGDTTTLIVSGAQLKPGHSYVLFLGEADLPGAKAALTVRDHSQGVFEIATAGGGLRATSQAAQETLVADERGEIRAEGGPQGFELEAMIQKLRELVGSDKENR